MFLQNKGQISSLISTYQCICINTSMYWYVSVHMLLQNMIQFTYFLVYASTSKYIPAWTSGSPSSLLLIWPATYSFDIILALSYIVVGTGPDCKPAPVPWLLSKKKFLQSLNCVAWLLLNSASSFDPPISECVLSMVQSLWIQLHFKICQICKDKRKSNQ